MAETFFGFENLIFYEQVTGHYKQQFNALQSRPILHLFNALPISV